MGGFRNIRHLSHPPVKAAVCTEGCPVVGDIYSLMIAPVSSSTLGRALTPRQGHVPGDIWMEVTVMRILSSWWVTHIDRATGHGDLAGLGLGQRAAVKVLWSESWSKPSCLALSRDPV